MRSVIREDMQMIRDRHPSAKPLFTHRMVSAAKRFVLTSQTIGKVSFTIAELCEETGLSAIAARDQLKRLGEQVVRVSPRQDFFLIVSPEQFAIGAPPVSWWLHAYFREQKSPYYLALLSAAAEYESSHQAVQTVQVITDKPRREISVGRIRIQFFVKKNIDVTQLRQIPNAFAPLNVSTPETTALDLVRYAHRIGGLGRAAQAIQGMLPKFTKAGLRNALNSENEHSTVQRLGYVLETLGQNKLCSLVEDRLPREIKRIQLELHKLDKPGQTMPFSDRWSVFINADITELS
jgi:hypothetical protein